MIIYKSNYRNHWISPYRILEHVFFWTAWSKCARATGIVEDADFVEPPAWVDRWADRLDPVCTVIKRVLDFVHPQINYIRIDPYDTWSMDHTLSDIILPMLRQLKATKHGSPHVEDSDVPEHLQRHKAEPGDNEWDTDSLWHMRWNWVLDEMIWAFEQKVADDAEAQFYDHGELDQLEDISTRAGRREWLVDINERVSKIKYDEAGHRAWQARKDNGLRLFGKYYEALWD